MSRPLGLGAMLRVLMGGEEHDPKEYAGKIVEAAWLDVEANKFHIKFADGIEIVVWDDGQDCCEERYMRTDDDPKDLVGGELLQIEAKPGPEEEDKHGAHDICFVEIATTKGHIVLANHNEHNGYYGGFGLAITQKEADDIGGGR